MFIEFLTEAEDAVGDSEFQQRNEFLCKDLADIGETGAGRNFGIDHNSATGTGMLVKRALASNETKVSSGFIERCLIFCMKSVLSLTKEEVFILC